MKKQSTILFARAIAIVLSVFAFLGSTSCNGSAHADVIVLDQVADAFGTSSFGFGGPTIDEFQTTFQTFTVGRGGVLARVGVQVQHGSGGIPNSDLVLTMRPTLANGDPDRTQDLGTVSLTANQVPIFDNYATGPFTAFDVRGLNIGVMPGDVLAFELSSSTSFGHNYFVYDSETDIYDGGSEFIFSPGDGFFFKNAARDLGFRTWVAVPEPSAFALLGLAGLLLVPYRSR